MSETGEYTCKTAADTRTALDILLTGEIDAVVLSASFDGVSDILDYCEPGNPSVLLVLDGLDDLDRLP
ncbi:MAG: hypothetical protein AAGC55_25615, partial [Myxococcota bacterium]